MLVVDINKAVEMAQPDEEISEEEKSDVELDAFEKNMLTI